MKQITVVMILAVVLGGTLMAFVVPSVGRSNNEILVREWTEISSDIAEDKSDKKTPEKAKAKEDTKDRSDVKKPIVSKKETESIKKVEGNSTSKVRKVTKQESLKLDPLKFSRAAHFRPVEKIVLDTVVTVSDTIVEVGHANSVHME